MKTSRNFALVALGSVLLAAFILGAPADVAWRTPLHLSEPTEIPGKVLPPGDYVVKVLNTTQTRSVVQFLNGQETEVVATVVAVPDYRITPVETSQFIYYQRAEGTPMALKSWMYPGNNWGIEFVYPREKATALAETSREPVYAVESQGEPDAKSEVVVMTPEKKEMKLEEYRAAAAPPPPAPVAAPANTERARTLPKTGSAVPLIGLAALASLASAAALRLVRRRA